MSRIVLAFLMILVATLGAAVAFWIALTEQQTARLHRQLTLGQMMEISLRHAVVSDLGFRVILENRQREHRARASAMQKTAERIRAEDASQAGQLDVQAQQEIVLARITGAILSSLRGWGTGSNTAERIASSVTADLVRLGFTRTHQPGAAASEGHGSRPEPSPISYEAAVGPKQLGVWQELTGEIEHLHHKVPQLALSIVLFVVALVCFTLTDLTASVSSRSNVCLALGVAVTIGATVFALIQDTTVWLPLALAVGVYAVLVLVGWRRGLFSHATEGETPHTPEVEKPRFWGLHILLRHAKDQREKTVIGLIAVTVLASSWVGYWYAHAQTSANEASHRAFASEVVLNNLDGERWVLARGGGMAEALELISARVKCAFASQRATLLPENTGMSSMRMADRDREGDCEVLKSKKNTDTANYLDGRFEFDAARSPAARIISDIYYGGSHNPAQLYAFADGYIGLAERWERKSAIYILGLTLFAIALYLFGQSLGMGVGLPSTVLAVCGTCLAIVAFGFAACVHREPPISEVTMPPSCEADQAQVERGRTPHENAIALAASFYGKGKALLEAAESGDEYANAAKALDCALAARSDFGRAQFDRSVAYSQISRADADGTYTSFPTKAKLRDVVTSLDRTIAALKAGGWSPSARMLNSQGFNALLTALTTRDVTLINTAIGAFQEGIGLTGIRNSDGKVDEEKVKAASRTDLDVYRMLHTNLALAYLAISRRQLADAAYEVAMGDLRLSEDQPLLASTITDLNILDAYCVNLHAAPSRCVEMKSDIEAAKRILLFGRVEAPGATRQARLSNVETWARPTRVGWSARLEGFNPEQDTLSVVWLALAPDWNVWRVVQPLFKPIDKSLLKTSGRVESVVLYDNSPSYCLPSGKYRAEFYLNGRLIPGVESKVVDVPTFSNYRSREMNIALCHPDDWQLSTFRQNEEGRHLVRAFTTKQGKSAAYLFTFFAPKGAGEAETKAAYRYRAWTLIKRWTQSAPSDEQFATALEKFQGCNAPIPGGTVLHREWIMPDGMVHVAFVIGDFARNGQACQVLESIGNYYDRSDAQQLARN